MAFRRGKLKISTKVEKDGPIYVIRQVVEHQKESTPMSKVWNAESVKGHNSRVRMSFEECVDTLIVRLSDEINNIAKENRPVREVFASVDELSGISLEGINPRKVKKALKDHFRPKKVTHHVCKSGNTYNELKKIQFNLVFDA